MSGPGFSDAEKAAMKERAEELKAEKGGNKAAKELQACLDKIAELEGEERAVAERVHVIVSEEAPQLRAKTWYGMPAYHRDGQIICFLQPASKFETRYSTLGFNDGAALDDGHLWPTAYAVTELGATEEKAVRELVRRAVGS